MSDLRIMLVILSIFLLVGSTLPFINSAFGGDYDENAQINQTDMITSIQDKETDENVSGVEVLKSIGLMFFWTFGALPMFLDLFFIIMRIMLVIVIYRQIRSGAG